MLLKCFVMGGAAALAGPATVGRPLAASVKEVRRQVHAAAQPFETLTEEAQETLLRVFTANAQRLASLGVHPASAADYADI